MKKLVVRALAAAVVTLGFTVAAQATPMYFDFTGTVLGSPGSAVTGGFNFEIDRLYSAPAPGQPQLVTFIDWQPTGLSAPLAFLNFGDRNVEFPAYGGINYLYSQFNDACTPGEECPASASDHWSIFASTSEQPEAGTAPDFTGSMRAAYLFFLPLDGLPQDTFDASTVDPTAILTLPLGNTLGIYSEQLIDCVRGECTYSNPYQLTFTIDSVSRGLGPRSVPEPGTFGLLGVALVGMFFVRRRRLALPPLDAAR